MNLTPEQYEALIFLADQQNDTAISTQMADLESVEDARTHTKLVIRQPTARTSLPNGPAPAAVAVINDNNEVIGELLLWIQDGIIDNVEQPWFTNTPPTSLPNRKQVRNYN